MKISIIFSRSTSPVICQTSALLWASQCTHPNISFSVNRLSQFLWDPSLAHWHAALRVLNYLASTKTLRLRLGGALTCEGYSDSNWAESLLDRRSTSSYVFKIGEGVISWKLRKQTTISLSSTEAEYKAMSDLCKEALWLRHVLDEIKLRPHLSIPLHVDNAGAEALSKNPQHHSRTKHIHTRFHFIRECVKKRRITVLHVSTKDMVADLLTKPLSRVAFTSQRSRLGLV